MAYEILTNEIGLILPTFPKDKRPKRGILTSVLGGIASSVIGWLMKVSQAFCIIRDISLKQSCKSHGKKNRLTAQQNPSFVRLYDNVWCVQFRHFDRTNIHCT